MSSLFSSHLISSHLEVFRGICLVFRICFALPGIPCPSATSFLCHTSKSNLKPVILVNEQRGANTPHFPEMTSETRLRFHATRHFNTWIAFRVSSSCQCVMCTQSAARSLAETMAEMTCEFQVVAVMFANLRHTMSDVRQKK